MSLGRFRSPVVTSRARVERSEAVLVEQYGSLVRLAYLVLPASAGRHRRILTAHSVVQRALPGAGGTAPRTPRVPAPRRGPASPAPATADPRNELRTVVLRAALGRGRRGRWPHRHRASPGLLPALPIVIGLRLLPRSGSSEDMTVARLLASEQPATRGAYVLRHMDRLPEPDVLDVLRAAGAGDPEGAVRKADRLRLDVGGTVGADSVSPGPSELDACTVWAQPTDLLRRRRRIRVAGAALLAGAVTATALVVLHDTPRSASEQPASAPAPHLLRRTAPETWADTSRVDFTAWPARGDRTRDDELLGRALETWRRPARTAADVALAPGTPADPPPRSPQLLYAGEVGGRAVVLLHDGLRLARYSEAVGAGDRAPALSVARADEADVTTAAAVTLAADGATARYLLAPWIAEAGSRDLLRPDRAATPLDVSATGVTEPVPVAPVGGGCERRPVLHLRSSSRIVEDHAFLVADLGGLSPTHLTYTPLPGSGTPPARRPREATGTAALTAWSRLACDLGSRPDAPVRAVNLWDFAEQRLPRGGGRVVWSCSRAVTWRGDGDVSVHLRTSGPMAARPVAREDDTAACSRFGQHVVAGTRWRSPGGDWYVLAAGSRAVTSLGVSGDVRAEADGRTLARRAARDAEFEVTGRLRTGEALPALPAARPDANAP
ncbi:hypothetical protein ACGF5T_17720 [Streptomyces sp. NPDC047853]|uniref:hypothetical protein n=1 Tax=unclassified Streptomyces TaxID=2593676 RepID=UPI003455748A